LFAQLLSDWLARRGIHFAWVIAFVTFLTMLTSAAALSLPGAMIGPISKEFGWTTEQISSALAVRFALFGLLGPFSAVFIERFGLRKVICTALGLIALAMALATQMSHLWNLEVLWGLLLGIGSGLTALVLGAVVSNRWFDKRRGLVVGMLTASSATGQLLFLPIAAWLIEHFGWRLGIVPVFASCASVALLVLLFLRDRPEELGLAPYGADPSEPVARAPTKKMSLNEPLRALASASKSPNFWILAGTFFICGLSTNGLIQTHFISLCSDYGMTAVPAASVLAMMGAFDFFGTISSGWLSDRYDSRKLLFWYYGLRGLSLFWLPHSEFSFYGLVLFATFYGLDWIATVPPTVRLTAQYFGRERAGMVFGWIFTAHQVGAAVAAYGAGLTRTLLLTYTPALYAAGAACLIASIAVMVIRRPQSSPVLATA
jgi:sugar phosphate permease